MLINRILRRVFYPNGRRLLLVVMLFFTGVPAQDNKPAPGPLPKQPVPKILFNQTQTEPGLSQNVITCSLQDKTGFLWFGTKDGLNRFDGYQFRVYRHVPNDQASISDSSITTIFEDKEGRMWVGTENGLNFFDRTRETFYRLLPDPSNPNSLSHQQIRSLAEDKEGSLWIGTPNGLNKLELAGRENPMNGGRFTIFKRDPNGFDDDNVGQVFADEAGTIWAKTNSGTIFSVSDDSHQNYVIKPLSPIGKVYFLNFCPGRNGRLWMAQKEGIFEWEIKNQQATFHPYSPEVIQAGMTIVTQIIEDRRGNIWFGGYWGLARLNPQNGTFDYFTSSQKDNLEINNPRLGYGINSILEDRSGGFWFGTNGKGLIRYDRQAGRFAHSNEQNSKLSLWHGTSVRTLIEADDGTMLVSSAGGWILRVNRTTGEAGSFKIPVNGVLQDTSSNSMLRDRIGRIWIGIDQALIQMDMQNPGNSTRYILEMNDDEGEKFVQKVFEDRDGNIWAVTGAKIYRLNQETNNFAGYQYDIRTAQERPYDNYVDLYEDQEGIFWLGTTDGLVRFDRKTESFKRFRNNPQDPNSLSHNVVRTLAPDPFEPNILWLGTKGAGLNRFDTASETFSVLTEKDGLPNNVVYGILSDEEGNLWMSTNNGISRFNPRTRIFRNFDKKDGLQDNEFNSCAFFKSQSGELFFGGINGFNAFYPAEVKDNPNPPAVVLTDFQILNQPVSFKTPDSPLKQTITETKEITLNYEQRFFSFDFAALDFTEPSKNQYAYQLEGFDQNLIEIGTRRTAFYTNVPPGSYVFRVIAANNDGVWNKEGVTLKMTVLPPFWRTWWFSILVTLAVSGVVFLFYQRRLSQLKQEKAMQEAFSRQLIEVQENDRKRIAAELHDGLGQSLLIIKNRAFLGEKATQKETSGAEKIESAREQFGEISESAAEALEQVREIAYYLRPSQLERLGLTSAIEEMLERAQDSTGIEFDVELPDLEGVFSPDDEINFFRIVQESVNNIIKHSGAKAARVVIQKVDRGIELLIEDNGQGFTTLEDQTKRQGFGLKGMSERARLIGGIYSIKSVPNEGTMVTVRVEK